jgi:hypothetical protein
LRPIRLPGLVRNSAAQLLLGVPHESLAIASTRVQCAAIMNAFEGGPGVPDDPGEDTIELELSPQDLLALSRPSEEESAPAPLVEAMLTSAEPAVAEVSSIARDTPRMDRWPLARVVGILGIAAAVMALGSAVHRAVVGRSVTTAAINPSRPAAATTRQPAEAISPVVQIRNPFDASEVFEFSPGTSEAEARQSVAKILLQRARDRQFRSGGAQRASCQSPDNSRAGC